MNSRGDSENFGIIVLPQKKLISWNVINFPYQKWKFFVVTRKKSIFVFCFVLLQKWKKIGKFGPNNFFLFFNFAIKILKRLTTNCGRYSLIQIIKWMHFYFLIILKSCQRWLFLANIYIDYVIFVVLIKSV